MLGEAGYDARTATLDEPEHGLTQEVLDNTDVLFWWGHLAHDEVTDEIVNRVHERVLQGTSGLVSSSLRSFLQNLQEVNGNYLRLEMA